MPVASRLSAHTGQLFANRRDTDALGGWREREGSQVRRIAVRQALGTELEEGVAPSLADGSKVSMFIRPLRCIVLALIVTPTGSLLAQPTASTDEPSPSAATGAELVLPKLTHQVNPTYPPEAIREGKSGQVLLQLDIDETGRVINAVVTEGLGFGMDEAALEAASQLLFEPARRGSAVIRARILYRMEFTLRATEPPAEATPEPARAPAPAHLVGTLRLDQSELPSVGTEVRVILSDGQTLRLTTDAEGHFELAELSAGVVTVEAEASGFAPFRSRETLMPGERLELTYRLRPTNGALEVVVQGERVDREITRRTMERKEMTLVPGTGGDALRAISAMPGVARTGAFDGLVVVRGSSPYGTQTFVDGTFTPQIYHFGGLSSVVPTEMIEAIDFYPGNFGAKYGRSTGGIIDVRLREMEEDPSYHGMAQVDLIDARLMLRGPVPLAKGWYFNAGARRSHIDAWIGSVVGEGAGFDTAPVYYDWQAFAETHPTTDSRFRIGVYGADDRLAMIFKDAMDEDPGMGNSLKIGTRMARLQATYEGQLSPAARLETTVAIGTDGEFSEFGALSSVNIDYIPIIARGELDVRLSDQWEVRAGPDVVIYRYDANVLSIAPPQPGEMEGNHANRPMLRFVDKGFFSAPAAYAEVAYRPTPPVQVVLGGRVDYFDLTNRWDVSPRLNARYDIHPGRHRTTLKGGVGLFNEPPQIIQAIEPFGNEKLKSNRSVHASLGIEQVITPQVDVSVEGFYKYLDRLVIESLDADGSQGFDNNASGYAYGTETMVRYKPGGRFFGWIAYTLSRSMRRSGPDQPLQIFSYDQTHNLTALGSYDLGRGFQVGGKLRIVTGNPYTPCNGGIQNAAAGTYECVEGETNSRRIPTFGQLDLRVDKTWKLGGGSLTAYLDVQNVTNRANAEGVSYNYRYTSTKWQTGLPIIPSLGLRGEF